MSVTAFSQRSESTLLTDCRLCALPVRTPVLSEEGMFIFCCNGCRNVWRILEDSGQLNQGTDPKQSSVYQQALQLGLLGNGQNPEASITESPDITPPDERGTIDDTRQCVLHIDGMWCSSCAWLIAEVLRRSRGVVSADVSFASDTARVTYKPARTGLDELRESIKSVGYESSEGDEAAGVAKSRERTRRRELIRVGIALFFAMNVMMLAPVIYASAAGGLTPLIAKIVPWMLFALSIPVFICALPLYDRAIRAARHGAATMETLVTVGASAAFIYSIYQLFHGTTRSYFDTADMLLALVLGGKLIESSIRADASDAVGLLRGLMPKKASVVRDGRELPVAAAQVAAGDLIRVRAGETIAADGTVERGSGAVDESLLTGEARPVEKKEGDSVTGGSTLQGGSIDVCVSRASTSGTLHQMAEMVEEALHKKARSERIADRISRIFVPVVILLSVATGTAVYVFGGHSLAASITRSVAVLVIACPCALGIATPMAIMAGVAAAAHRGILIADPDALDIVTRLRRIVFDKTGTLTEGAFRVRHVQPENASLNGLYGLEKYSEHSIARAILSYAKGRNEKDDLPEIADFQHVDGMGVTGTVGELRQFAGNIALAQLYHAVPTREMAQTAKEWSESGQTVIYYGQEGNLEAIIALGDTLRDGIRETVARLAEFGITAEIVSGDAPATVASIASQAGIAQWRGAVLPSQKLELMGTRQAEASASSAVAMVGDGVNDAPALARADLGIAMASGADIASKAASVTLLSGSLERLVDLVAIARESSKVIHQNLFWAFSYNIVCIPLAMAGVITPIWAAVSMLVSSITVLVNTRRLVGILSRIG